MYYKRRNKKENENIHYEKNRIKKNTKSASFETIIDAQNFMRDIKRFIEHDISIIKKNGNNNTKRGTTYNITLPVLISKMIHIRFSSFRLSLFSQSSKWLLLLMLVCVHGLNKTLVTFLFSL